MTDGERACRPPQLTSRAEGTICQPLTIICKWIRSLITHCEAQAVSTILVVLWSRYWQHPGTQVGSRVSYTAWWKHHLLQLHGPSQDTAIVNIKTSDRELSCHNVAGESTKHVQTLYKHHRSSILVSRAASRGVHSSYFRTFASFLQVCHWHGMIECVWEEAIRKGMVVICAMLPQPQLRLIVECLMMTFLGKDGYSF